MNKLTANIYLMVIFVFYVQFISTFAANRKSQESQVNIRQKRINQDDNTGHQDVVADNQQFLPSFGPLFGQAFGRARSPRVYQEAEYLPEIPTYHLTAAASNRESAMLGSGNFGIIPGGTYYSDGTSESGALIDQFQYDGNSHGRPHRFSGNPRPSPYKDPEDFFADFRDFADITAPAKSSFSEHHMVYASADDFQSVADEKIKSKKKRKLNKHQENEKDKLSKAKRIIHTGEKELYEPMIALSR
ncbi:uncharacterized protein LOC126906924 [Daktulosphaira vitifoliae]|uniref:uncharacterized protein LOC126906924 n=1 Tax=Daktulosphaira vitifoliae TaxID=58002 RepID=UPI0021AA7B9E|nr:uncharacterized protein LOC126906924 [Daktulosphaira vitifoliae]